MAHEYQIEFIRTLKSRKPQFFHYVSVLDCGSLDINGNNRWAFEKAQYLGVDIVKGDNVDIRSRVHELDIKTIGQHDVVISTEMLEHDQFWRESIMHMFNLLKPGGLLLITAAGTGRPEHGTHDRNPEASPETNDFYQNLTIDLFKSVFPAKLDQYFSEHGIYDHFHDFQFYGIKRMDHV